MMTKLEKPIWMTVEEADKKYYPNSYVMVNCEIDQDFIVLAGEVMAYAPSKNGGVLSQLKMELARSGEYGEVSLNRTKDPLDGGVAVS